MYTQVCEHQKPLNLIGEIPQFVTVLLGTGVGGFTPLCYHITNLL